MNRKNMAWMPYHVFSILSAKNFTIAKRKINGTLHLTELKIFHYYTKYNIVTLHYLKACLKVKVQKKEEGRELPHSPEGKEYHMTAL